MKTNTTCNECGDKQSYPYVRRSVEYQDEFGNYLLREETDDEINSENVFVSIPVCPVCGIRDLHVEIVYEGIL